MVFIELGRRGGSVVLDVFCFLYNVCDGAEDIHGVLVKGQEVLQKSELLQR
jgi:hypothetical protein